ncbi:MAG: sigma-E processing peptidase SpoIIGA [Clostridiales bacterium]|nr:sigma-E processing peptidase SpoIIGA [Clostridiales bacterium]
MIVYVDILFAVNMLMDLTIIWAAGVLLKRKIIFYRLLLGSAAGAAMYIAVLYRPYINGFVQLLTIIMSIVLSLAIAFAPIRLFELARLTLVSLAVSFATAGIMISILCLRSLGIVYTAKNIFDSFSYSILFISSAAIYAAIKLFGKAARNIARDRKQYFDAAIKLNGIQANVRALADSGNSLKDNLGGNDVIIAEYSAVKSLLPDIVFTYDAVELFKALSVTDYKTRIRLIPFKSLGNENGLLLGIRVDEAEIKYGSTYIRKENIIIGIYCGRLDNAGRFNAIINYDIIL